MTMLIKNRGKIRFMGTSSKKILIVEDNAVQAMTLKKLLERLGHDIVAIVERGEKAVRKTNTLHPDLIIMDIFLDGDMTGIQAMNEVRKTSDVPVIYISGNSDSYYRKLAEKTTLSQFFCKPVNHKELGEAVERMIAGDDSSKEKQNKSGKSLWPFGLFV